MELQPVVSESLCLAEALVSLLSELLARKFGDDMRTRTSLWSALATCCAWRCIVASFTVAAAPSTVRRNILAVWSCFRGPAVQLSVLEFNWRRAVKQPRLYKLVPEISRRLLAYRKSNGSRWRGTVATHDLQQARYVPIHWMRGYRSRSPLIPWTHSIQSVPVKQGWHGAANECHKQT